MIAAVLIAAVVAAVAAAVRRQWLEGGSEKTKREGLGGLGGDDGSWKGASAPLRRTRKEIGGGGDGGGGDGGGGGDDGRAVAVLRALCYVAAPEALYPLAPPAPTVVLKGGVDWGGIGEGAPARGSGRRFGF